MTKTILSFLVSFNAFALNIPNSWLSPELAAHSKKFNNQWQEESFSTSLDNIVERHEVALTSVWKRFRDRWSYNLDRFDLSLGLSATGTLGILSFEGAGALEFIWKKNQSQVSKKKSLVNSTKELNLSSFDSEKMITEKMYNIIIETLRERKVGFIQKTIIKTSLRAEAKTLKLILNSLITMPQVGSWHISGFHKTFSFAINGAILDEVGVGYSNRIRFRFKITDIPFRKSSIKELNSGQKVLENIMHGLNRLSAQQIPRDQFKLYRTWSHHNFSLGLELIALNTNYERGLVIEYRKTLKENNLPKIANLFAFKNFKLAGFNSIQKINDFILKAFQEREYNDQDEELSLSSIRISYSASKGLEFYLASLEHNQSLQLHYKRNIPSGHLPSVSEDEHSYSISQFDNRHRLSGSYSFPGIRLRARPSIEYRYKPIK